VELCDRVETHPVLTALRGGIAYGEVLSVAGDYFGPPVNLAARAAALAPPGRVPVTAEVVAAAPEATVGRRRWGRGRSRGSPIRSSSTACRRRATDAR
jgi:adenylate cyclase